jgi:Cys-rich protein (TIGR01571 family)
MFKFHKFNKGRYTGPVHEPGMPKLQLAPYNELAPPSKWSSSLCDCCRDTPSCIEVAFCKQCQLSYQELFLFSGYDDGCDCCAVFVTLFFDALFFCVVSNCNAMTLRQIVRVHFHIEPRPGSQCCIMDDWLGFFCSYCSLCQTYRELAIRGAAPSTCISCNVPPAHERMGELKPSQDKYEKRQEGLEEIK